MRRLCAILEYDKIIGLLAERASSALGAERASSLLPAVSPNEIRQRLSETADAVSFIMQKGAIGLGEFGDISQPVSYAEKGGSLTPAQLLAVSVQMAAARRAVGFLKVERGGAGARESAGASESVGAGAGTGKSAGAGESVGAGCWENMESSTLVQLASVISVRKDIEDRIRSSILSDTEIADGASAELRRIRRQIANQSDNIRAQLNRLVSSPSYRDILQDQIVTQRDGRWVVPVKQENAKSVPGIIHDRSKGGATVFIEPQSVVNANNALRELEIAEHQEIDRILAELSALVAGAAEELRVNQDMLVRIDFIFAKGLLAADMDAVRPEISEALHLEIDEGRHPLIPADHVVPISLSLGESYNTLIITGPNTGGKTVTLKTVGLFVLMAQAGLHLPAAHAVIPAAQSVFADIGDEQSIEQSLSTFSSHMKNIVEITEQAGRGSIVFLDELGAGTDPTEGAALAMSILDTLGSRGCMVIATTHYTELKKYALATEGVENASMEFNVETLSPTYRLMVGLPGRSNAFEISRKLGLPEELVARAAQSMDSGSIAFETVIEQAESGRRAAEAARRDAENVLKEIESEREALDIEVRKFEDKKDALLEKAREESLAKIAEADEYADIIRAELKALLDEAGDIIELAKSGALTAEEAESAPTKGDFYRKLDENRKMLKQLDGEYRKVGKGGRGGSGKGRVRGGAAGRDGAADSASSAGKLLKPGDVKIGDAVRLVTLDAEGEVATLPDDKGELQILVGRIRMTVPISDLRSVRAESGSGRKGSGRRGASRSGRGAFAGSGVTGAARIQFSKASSVSSSIDLHGYKLDEAIMTVDKYIDDAVLAGYGEVCIVHGRGEGILRSGLRSMLRKHSHVKKIRSGNPGEGGDGTTVVTLR